MADEEQQEDATVTDIFTREVIRKPISDGHEPDSEEAQVDAWILNYLNPVAEYFKIALDTFDVEEFRRAVREIKSQVTEWPDP